MNKVYLILLFLSLFSCNSQKKEYIKTIKQWQNKEIHFPSKLNAKIIGRDTVCSEIFQKEYKILRYIDSTGCTSCKLKLYEWKLFIEEFNKFNNNLSFIFIVHSKDYKKIEELVRENLFNYPILYDENNDIDKINKLPKSSLFQTFLLDKNNKVLLIGDPMQNKSMLNLYKKKIKSL